MNVLLLGATGTAGHAIAEKLLKETDCNITLFSRHIQPPVTPDPRVSVSRGDAANIDDLTAALQGQHVVCCAISGHQLPQIARHLVTAMPRCGVDRLIFMGAVGIYNELPRGLGDRYNVDNEPPQIPNRQAVDVIEASPLNYTVMRPGFLRDGKEDNYVLTVKGEPAKGYVTTIPSVAKLALRLILDDALYARQSVAITRDMTRQTV